MKANSIKSVNSLQQTNSALNRSQPSSPMPVDLSGSSASLVGIRQGIGPLQIVHLMVSGGIVIMQLISATVSNPNGRSSIHSRKSVSSRPVQVLILCWMSLASCHRNISTRTSFIIATYPPILQTLAVNGGSRKTPISLSATPNSAATISRATSLTSPYRPAADPTINSLLYAATRPPKPARS